VNVLDLCCGTKSATAPFRNRGGHQVIGVDVVSDFRPEIIADVREFTAIPGEYDFIWASPPCTEFAREFMPWCRTGVAPDMAIVKACARIIEIAKPKYWVIENVKGAVKYFQEIGLGYPRAIVGPFYLWGNFPPLAEINRRNWRKKENRSSSADAARGAIPIELAEAVYQAVTLQDRF